MATTLGPPSGVAPPPGQPPDRSKSARAELARREDPTARIVRVVLLLVALLVLVRGWMVTEIDLGKLTNASNAGPILKALLQPDVASRDQTPIELSVPFIVGAGSNGPATTTNDSGQTLRITPGSGNAGAER